MALVDALPCLPFGTINLINMTRAFIRLSSSSCIPIPVFFATHWLFFFFFDLWHSCIKILSSKDQFQHIWLAFFIPVFFSLVQDNSSNPAYIFWISLYNCLVPPTLPPKKKKSKISHICLYTPFVHSFLFSLEKSTGWWNLCSASNNSDFVQIYCGLMIIFNLKTRFKSW